MVTFKICNSHIYTRSYLVSLYIAWAWLRLKSPMSRLFAQAKIKENIKTVRYLPLWGESSGDRGFPLQRASNAENVSIWWRHHDVIRSATTVVTSSTGAFMCGHVKEDLF